MKPAPSPITCPRRKCSVCKQYRSTVSGCQHGNVLTGPRPFICAGCMGARRG